MRLLLAAVLLMASAVALGAEPQIVLDIQRNGEAFVIDASVEVAVPLRTAWDVLTDFDHMAVILADLTQSRITARNGSILNVAQEGRARYGIFSYSFSSEREIRLEPMQRIVARQLKGTSKRFESEMGLASTDGGTRLRYHAEIVPDSLIARTLGGSFVEHEVAEQLAAMAAEMVRRKVPPN